MINYKYSSSCIHSILSSERGKGGKGYMKLLNNIFKLTHYIVKSIDSLLSSQSEEFMKIYLPHSQWNILRPFSFTPGHKMS